MKKYLATAALLVTSAASAHAGSFSNDFALYADAMTHVWDNPRGYTYDAKGCTDTIEFMRETKKLPEDTELSAVEFKGLATAVPDPDRVDKNTYFLIKLRDAHLICEGYDREWKLVHARENFGKLAAAFDLKPTETSDEGAVREQIETCTRLADDVVANNLSDRPIKLGTIAFTFSTAKQKLCAPLAKYAEEFAGAVRAAKQEAADKITAQRAADAKAAAAEEQARLAPFRKLGITGERLDLVGQYSDALVAPGQRTLTVKQQATAPVMFTSSQDDSVIRVTKYVFKGNKLLNWKTKTYSRLHYGINDARLYR